MKLTGKKQPFIFTQVLPSWHINTSTQVVPKKFWSFISRINKLQKTVIVQRYESKLSTIVALHLKFSTGNLIVLGKITRDDISNFLFLKSKRLLKMSTLRSRVNGAPPLIFFWQKNPTPPLINFWIFKSLSKKIWTM